ncbi:MAG: HIT family protein [Sedimentisphaerales bacterium]|nr:HIT family protein [Sedimentisphaerales bacterium]
MGADCVFCQIVNGSIPACKIYEDQYMLSFLDIAPVSPGHCLLIPKKHYATLSECPQEVVAQLAGQLAAIGDAVVGATKAQGYNILNNNGRCAGQLVGHVHFHIIPRIEGDGVLSGWPAGKYPQGLIEEIAKEIKSLL